MTESLTINLLAFGIAAVVIAVAGVRLTAMAQALARDTGWGEALLGGVVIGAMTSLAGTVTSVTAAAQGHADLAVGNALGGIAAQTAFLVVADGVYRRANLEHAAASEGNLLQGVLLIALLSLPLGAMLTPEFAWFGVHPATPLLFAAYLGGISLVYRSRAAPMWYPRRTADTRSDPVEAMLKAGAGGRRWWQLAGLVLLVAAAGWVVAESGLQLARLTGLSESLIGTLFTALSTSLPELVIAVAAVRRGAVILAVGDIVGGNTFDVLFLGLSDLGYRAGSIYHAVTPVHGLWLVVCILMTAILMLGLLRRERHGFANIGFESLLVLLVYLGALALLVKP